MPRRIVLPRQRLRSRFFSMNNEVERVAKVPEPFRVRISTQTRVHCSSVYVNSGESCFHCFAQPKACSDCRSVSPNEIKANEFNENARISSIDAGCCRVDKQFWSRAVNEVRRLFSAPLARKFFSATHQSARRRERLIGMRARFRVESICSSQNVAVQ